jgi:hypothetical protein
MLDQTNFERKQLLESVLEASKPKVAEVAQEETKIPIKPQFIPWRIRQQMLETEDREKAKLIKQASAAVEKVDVSDLEKELEIVQKEKEA